MLTGLAVGLVLSVYLTRGLESMLIDVDRRDPLAYGLTLAVLLLTAALATWIPARRAAGVDPSVALRSE